MKQFPVRILVSDELGQVKLLQAPSSDALESLSIVKTWGKPDREAAVQALTIGSAHGAMDTATATAALGRKNGTIDIIDPNTGNTKFRIERSGSGEDASIETLHVSFSGPATSAASPTIVSCTAGGVARIHSINDELASWKVPATVCSSSIEETEGLLAVGSQGAELRIYNLALPAEPVFVAKGSKPNRIGLQDRPWNSAVAFCPGSNGKQVWCGTGHHKLRLYDVNASKRPQKELEFGQSRITAIQTEPDGNRVWVANGMGQLEVYDVRGGRFQGAIKGIAGSIRALSTWHHTTDTTNSQISRSSNKLVIASVGLDRFLRIHDTSTRKSLGKIYLKTQLTGVAMCPTDASMITMNEDNNGEDDNDGDANGGIDRVDKKTMTGDGKRKSGDADDTKGMHHHTENGTRRQKIKKTDQKKESM